jgi:predicted ABC-type ATPase
MPDLFIVAGPNGAGKSTFAGMYLPHEVQLFNGDAVFASLQKTYPNLSTERLSGGVAVALEKARDLALAEPKSFAFETNYSTNLAQEMVRLFKEKGYNCNLIYFGLDNIFESSARVNNRVKLGGHDVSKEIIVYNFDEGVKRIKKDLPLFDNIEFVRTDYEKPIEIIAIINHSNKYKAVWVNGVSWFDEHFRQTFEKIEMR